MRSPVTLRASLNRRRKKPQMNMLGKYFAPCAHIWHQSVLSTDAILS